MVNVLDHGYVRLVDHMGDDLSIVNAARVSFEKESAEFNNKDAKLIAFLARRDENSPLRHSVLSFEVYAPLMVARQWYKYAVASTHVDDQFGWNESSRRYVTEEPVFYIPASDQWREAPEDKKQGSGKTIKSWNKTNVSYGAMKMALEADGEDVREFGNFWTNSFEQYMNMGYVAYTTALEMNIAPEQARLFLPAYAMYVRWRWTASTGAVMHFLNQRLEDKAQYEIKEYALAVKQLTAEKFPATVKEFVGDL